MRLVQTALLVALAWTVVMPASVCAQEDLEATLTAEQARLDSLEQALADARERLKNTTGAVESTAERLRDLEKDIFLTRREHGRLARREKAMASRLVSSRQEVASIESRVRTREASVARRLRGMYKRGRTGELELLFSAESVTEGLRRLQYMARAAVQDRRDFEGLKADRQKLLQALNREKREHGHQLSLVKAKKDAEQTLDLMHSEEARKRRRLQTRVAAEKETMAAFQAQLEASKALIVELIQEMERLRRQGGRLVELPAFDLPEHRGKLAWPVKGQVLSRFGRHQDPELMTWTFNRGVNVASPPDTDVLTVAPGEVMVVDWYRGYGQFVLLRHPGGFYTLYAHLGSVRARVGEILDEGAVLGTVGDSGRLDGVSQLHFEVIQGEEPLDPVEWLAP